MMFALDIQLWRVFLFIVQRIDYHEISFNQFLELSIEYSSEILFDV